MNLQNIQFEIKQLSIADVSQFLQAHDNDYFEKLSDRVDINEYSKKVVENATHFTVSDNKQLLGFSPCYFNNIKDKTAYISSLTIKQGFRGKRLGSELIKKVMQHAKENNFIAVMVKIHYLNDCCHQFYQKNGFSDFVQDKENGFRLLKSKVS